MTAGFQDYALIEPIFKSIGQETPGMQGGQLACVAGRISGNEQVRLTAEEGLSWSVPGHTAWKMARRPSMLGWT
jgi:hypothetical protein